MEHRAGEGDEVQPSHGPWQPLVVLGQPPNRDAHAKERSTTHRRGNSTKPRWACERFTISSRMPRASASASGRFPV